MGGTAVSNQEKLHQQYEQTIFYDSKVEQDGDTSPAGKSNIQILLDLEVGASEEEGKHQQHLHEIFEGLIAEMSDDDADLLLVQAIIIMKRSETATANQQLQVTEEQRQQEREKREKLLAKAAEKMDASEAKRKDVDVWSKIKLAFEWIGAAIMIAVGVALAAAGAAPLAAMMIGIGLLALLGAIDSTTSTLSASKLGIAGNLWLSVGVNKKDAAGLDLAAKIWGAILTTAIAAAMFWLPATEVTVVMQWIQIGSSIGTIAIDVGTATGDTVASVYTYQATMAQADAKDIQADAKKFEANTGTFDAFVEDLIRRIGNLFDRFNDMVETMASAIDMRNSEILRITFTL
jgi:hypothetical protein